jgi:hypothetical protein
MPFAVSKDEFPHLNRQARERLWTQRQRATDEQSRIHDGFEVFEDACYYDMICVRPAGSRDFNDTVHVASHAIAMQVVAWLNGRVPELGIDLPERDIALLRHWKDNLPVTLSQSL